MNLSHVKNIINDHKTNKLCLQTKFYNIMDTKEFLEKFAIQ